MMSWLQDESRRKWVYVAVVLALLLAGCSIYASVRRHSPPSGPTSVRTRSPEPGGAGQMSHEVWPQGER